MAKRVSKKTGANRIPKGRDIVSPSSGKEVLAFNQSTINAINKAGPKGHEIAHILPREGRILEAFGGSGEVDKKTKIKSYAPVKTGYEKGVVESGSKLPKGPKRGRLDSDHQVAVLTDPEVEALNTMRWRDKDRGFTSGFGPEITALAKQNDKPFDFVEYQGEKIPTLNDSGSYGGGPQGSGSTGGNTGNSGSKSGQESAMQKFIREYGEEVERKKKEKAAKEKAARDKAAKEKREREAAAKAAIAAAEKKERERLAAEKAAAEKAAREKAAREKAAREERERIAKEKTEREERERIAREQAIADKAAADKVIADQAIADAQQAAEDKAEAEAAAEAAAQAEAQAEAEAEVDLDVFGGEGEPEQDRGDHGTYDPSTNTVTYDTTGQEGENLITHIDENISGDDWSNIPEGEVSGDTAEYDPSNTDGQPGGTVPDNYDDYGGGDEGQDFGDSDEDYEPEDGGDVEQVDESNTDRLGIFQEGYDKYWDNQLEEDGSFNEIDDPYGDQPPDDLDAFGGSGDPEYDTETETTPDNYQDSDFESEYEDTTFDPQTGESGGDFEDDVVSGDYGGEDGEFGDGTFDPDTGVGDGDTWNPEDEYGEDGEFGDGTFDPDTGLGDGDTGNDDPIIPDNNNDDNSDTTDTTVDVSTGNLSDADRQTLMDALDKQYGEYAETDYEALYKNEFSDDLTEDYNAATKGLDYNFLTSNDRSEYNTFGNTVNDQNDYLGDLLAGGQNDYLNTMSGNFGTGAKNAMNDWYVKNRQGINNLEVAEDGTYNFDFTDLDLSGYSDPGETYDPEFFSGYDKKYEDPDKTYYGGIEGGVDPAETTPKYPDDDDDPRTDFEPVIYYNKPKPKKKTTASTSY